MRWLAATETGGDLCASCVYAIDRREGRRRMSARAARVLAWLTIAAVLGMTVAFWYLGGP